MSRGIDSSLKIESKTNTIIPIILIKIDFNTPIYLHTSIGDIVYDGDTYLGVGALGGISPISESIDMSSNGVNLSLSGVDQSLINSVVNNDYRNTDVTVFFGFLDETSYTLITPTIIYQGQIDNNSININNDTFSINLSVLNKFSKWDRVNPRRFNLQDQTSIYPNDKAFLRQGILRDQNISWGGGEYILENI